jgi:hypothetical protein
MEGTTMQPIADGIDREPITSSNLVSIGYDAERKMLAVEFKSGLVMHYRNVNLNLATDFYGATSRGAFYAAFIRGKFPAERMTGPCLVCGAVGIVRTRCACGQGDHVRVTHRPEPAQDTTAVAW